jgi:hypothetical protein
VRARTARRRTHARYAAEPSRGMSWGPVSGAAETARQAARVAALRAAVRQPTIGVAPVAHSLTERPPERRMEPVVIDPGHVAALREATREARERARSEDLPEPAPVPVPEPVAVVPDDRAESVRAALREARDRPPPAPDPVAEPVPDPVLAARVAALRATVVRPRSVLHRSTPTGTGPGRPERA